MLIPVDAINYTVEEAHYCLASLPLQDNRPLMDQANFTLRSRIWRKIAEEYLEEAL